jgi:hypothetical protein
LCGGKYNEAEVAELDHAQQTVHGSIAQVLFDVFALLSDPNNDGDEQADQDRASSNTPPDQELNEQVLDRRVRISKELRYAKHFTGSGSRINIDNTRARQPRLTESEHDPLPVPN